MREKFKFVTLKARAYQNRWFLLISAANLLMLFKIIGFDPDPHHDGMGLALGVSVSEGSKLYESVETYYQPVSIWLSGAWFKIFPSNLLSLRFLTMILILVVAAMIWKLGKLLSSEKVGVLAASLWFLGNTAFLDYWPLLYWPNLVAGIPFLATSVYLFSCLVSEVPNNASDKHSIITSFLAGFCIAVTLFTVFLCGVLLVFLWMTISTLRIIFRKRPIGNEKGPRLAWYQIISEFIGISMGVLTILSLIGFNNLSNYWASTLASPKEKFSTGITAYLESITKVTAPTTSVFLISVIFLLVARWRLRNLGISQKKFVVSGLALMMTYLASIISFVWFWNNKTSMSTKFPTEWTVQSSISLVIQLSIGVPAIAVLLLTSIALVRRTWTRSLSIVTLLALTAIGYQTVNSLHSQDLTHLWWGSILAFISILVVLDNHLKLPKLFFHCGVIVALLFSFLNFLEKQNFPREAIKTPNLATQSMEAEPGLAQALTSVDRYLTTRFVSQKSKVNYYCIDLLYAVFRSRLIATDNSLFWPEQRLRPGSQNLACGIFPPFALSGLERWTETGFQDNNLEFSRKSKRIEGETLIIDQTRDSLQFEFDSANDFLKKNSGLFMTAGLKGQEKLDDFLFRVSLLDLNGKVEPLTNWSSLDSSVSFFWPKQKSRFIIEFLKTTSESAMLNYSDANVIVELMSNFEIYKTELELKWQSRRELTPVSSMVNYSYGEFVFPYSPYFVSLIEDESR